MGIKDIRKMNISLLCKWWWRLEKEDGSWQKIVRYKYLRTDSIHTVSHKLNDSHMWYDLLKIKDFYLQGRSVSIKNGENTRFWLDPWLYNKSICEITPILFQLCEHKDAFMAQVKNGTVNIQFRRWLYGELAESWDKIWEDVDQLFSSK